jgi:hypothetical protein
VINQANINLVNQSVLNQKPKIRNASNDLTTNKLSIKIDPAITQLGHINMKGNSRNMQPMKGSTRIPINPNAISSFSNNGTQKVVSQKAKNLGSQVQPI